MARNSATPGRSNPSFAGAARRWGVAAVALTLAACGARAPTGPTSPPQFAELMPTAMMAPAAAPPAPAIAPPPAPTGPMYGGHLASYFKEADAIRGWNTIVAAQSIIASLTRHITPLKTDRGAMVRLIAGDFPSQDEAARFCTWAKQQRLYCVVMTVDGQVPPPPARATPAAARQRATAPAASSMAAPMMAGLAPTAAAPVMAMPAMIAPPAALAARPAGAAPAAASALAPDAVAPAPQRAATAPTPPAGAGAATAPPAPLSALARRRQPTQADVDRAMTGVE